MRREGETLKDFLYFNEYMSKEFLKILQSSVDLNLFEKHVRSMVNFAQKDFPARLQEYGKTINVNSIVLENVVDAKYKFLLKGIELREALKFVQELVSRMDEFKGKDNSLIVVVGFYALYYSIILKLVDVYLGAVAAFNAAGSTNTYSLNDVGIDESILRYYRLMENIREKTVDEWIAIDCTDVEERYISSATKRILMLFGY